MTNKKLILLILFFLIFSAYQSTAQNIVVKGVIFEKQSMLPIEFVNVTVLKTDSSLVGGILTQANGTFSISLMNTGKYILKLFSIGYETTTINFTVPNVGQLINLDSLGMNVSTKFLGEVTVTGKKSVVANNLDKQTFRANEFESAKGGSATDVLKNLPSVSVNSSGEISVRGSNGFLILIDGKPVLTDAQTILSQLPANTIENIELITAPSAKYDADGKAGIINITTKRSSTDGIGVQANLQMGLPSTTDYNNLENPVRFGGDVAINFKKNKWDVFVALNYTRNDANGQRDGDVYTKNFVNNTITRLPSSGERSFDRFNYGFRSSMTYVANRNNVFNVGLFTSKKYQQRRADIVYNNSTASLITDITNRRFTYFNSNLQTKEGLFTLGSLDYTHTFEDKSKLSSSIIYEYGDLYGNTLNKNLDYPAQKTVFQVVTNPYSNPIGGYRFKFDYSKTIGTGKMEMGYQFRNDEQDGRFGYTVSPTVSQPDSAKFRGTARSTNQISALYAQYANTTTKLQHTLGLRYEYAMREVFLSSDVNSYQLNLSNFFPSINLLYTVNDLWNIKAGYSKRVQRNNNYELNPIPEREHSETLEQGDANLLPQFIDLVELGVNHNFESGSFFATLYYQNIKNPIQRVNSIYADTILNRVFTNAAKARLIGLEIGSTFKPTKWISAYVGANVYNYKISGGLNVLGSTSTVNNSDWVYSFSTNTTFDLGKSWSLQANINYLSAKPTAQGQDSRFFLPNTSIKKVFKESGLSLAILWQNMNLGFMNSNQQRITTQGRDFYTTTNYIYETDVFLVNLSFNLNKLSTKTKLPTSELGEKEF